MRAFTLAVAAGAACAVAAPAAAITPIREPVQVEVRIAQGDLRNAGATEQVYQSLLRASREACDSRMPRNRAVVLADRACAREALNQTVAALAQPLLTARHEQTPFRYAAGWR